MRRPGMRVGTIHAVTHAPAPPPSPELLEPLPAVLAPAMGHGFGEELVCLGCARTWHDHQAEPAECRAASSVSKAKNRRNPDRCRRGHEITVGEWAYGRCRACDRDRVARHREQARRNFARKSRA